MATSSSSQGGLTPLPSVLRGLLARGWGARDQVLVGSAAGPASAAVSWQNEMHKDAPSAAVGGDVSMRQSGSTARPQLTAPFRRFPGERYALVRAWPSSWGRVEAAQQQQAVVATDLVTKRQVLLTCFAKGVVTEWQLEHAVRVMTTLGRRHPRGFQTLLRIWDADSNWVVVQALEASWSSARASGFADPAQFSEEKLRAVVFQVASLVHFLHSHTLSLGGELWQHDMMLDHGNVTLLLPMHAVVSGSTLVPATERTRAADVAAIGMLMCQLAMMPCSPTAEMDIRHVQGALEDQLAHLSPPCRAVLFDCLTQQPSVQELLARKWLRSVDFLSTASRLECTPPSDKVRGLLYKSLLWKLAAFCMLDWLRRAGRGPVDKATEEEEEAEGTRQRSRTRPPGRRHYSTSRRLLVPSGTLRRGPVPVPVPGHSVGPQEHDDALELNASDKAMDDARHRFLLPLEAEAAVSKSRAVYDDFKYEFPSVVDAPEAVHYDAFELLEDAVTEQDAAYRALLQEDSRECAPSVQDSAGGSDRSLQREIVRSLRHDEAGDASGRDSPRPEARGSCSPAPPGAGSALFARQGAPCEDPVLFSAFAPARLALCEWFRLDLWAYVKQQRETMLETALARSEAECGRRLQPLRLARGTLVTVSIEPSPSFQVQGESCQSFQWRGDLSSVSFDLQRVHAALGSHATDEHEAEDEDELCVAKIVAGANVSLLYIRLHGGPAAASDVALLDTELTPVASSLQTIPAQELEVLRPLGHGAFGDAVLARWTRSKRDVVVKTLSEDACRPSDAQAELRHEATVMHLLGHHPHVVELLGVSSLGAGDGDAACSALVTEYVPNGSVQDVLAAAEASGSPLSLFSRTLLARDAAHGLANVHEGGVLHRDVAARNCLVDAQFRVKVCDFGLSRRLRRGVWLDDERRGFGPLKWMAPESIAPPHLFSTHSDVYMFGVLLYELFSGHAPFPSLSARDAAALILEGHHVPIPSALPPTHRELMRQCFDVHPLRRPPMQQLYRALDHWTLRDTKEQATAGIEGGKPARRRDGRPARGHEERAGS